MKKFESVLVTGCGGDIGTAVGRVLKELNIAERVIGADLTRDNAGAFVFDAVDILPRADSAEYRGALEDIVKKYHIERIIPMSEAEIRAFQKSGSRVVAGASCILANQEALRVGHDKLETNAFLKSHGLPCPWTSVVRDGPPRELPCIIKSRTGRGSKGVMKVEDEELVRYLAARRPDDIWQEYLMPDDEEYTCGLYGCADGSVRTIILKRTLVGGLTGQGDVAQNADIEKVLRASAAGLNVRGSINVQLRLTSKGPMIFEINPRFSSTVAFRHTLGFKDVLWSLEESVGESASPYVPPKVGTKFYKGYTEYIAR